MGLGRLVWTNQWWFSGSMLTCQRLNWCAMSISSFNGARARHARDRRDWLLWMTVIMPVIMQWLQIWIYGSVDTQLWPGTLWLFNIAMENDPFIDDFPIKTTIYSGFSMAMLNNQMVPMFFFAISVLHLWRPTNTTPIQVPTVPVGPPYLMTWLRITHHGDV